MRDELFTIELQDSPRLAWLKNHEVKIIRNQGVSPGDECPESGEPIYPWCAFVGESEFPKPDGWMGCGDSEHEAIVDLAIKRGWRLWNEDL